MQYERTLQDIRQSLLDDTQSTSQKTVSISGVRKIGRTTNHPRPEIREDMPLPTPTKGRKATSKFKSVFELEIGQTAVWNVDEMVDPAKFQRSLCATVYKHARQTGKKFSVQKIRDDNKEVVSIGVWRKE